MSRILDLSSPAHLLYFNFYLIYSQTLDEMKGLKNVKWQNDAEEPDSIL